MSLKTESLLRRNNTWNIGQIICCRALVLILVMGFSAAAYAQDPLIVANTASSPPATFKPIATYSIPPGGAPVASFVPPGSFLNNNGGGVAVLNNEVFYTLVNPVASGDIVVAPFNNGAGGPTIRTLPNPRPFRRTQALVFSQGVLYALNETLVFGLSAVTGAVVSGPVTIVGPVFLSEGFTVLPNGNFLINNSFPSSCTYNEYDPATGVLIPATTRVIPGTGCSGVDTDGVSLYFQVNDSIVKTTLAGTVLNTYPVTVPTSDPRAPARITDIEVAHNSRFMTGGGGVMTGVTGKVTHGFELYCDGTQAPSNNLEVNWGRGNHFHLTNITSATCGGPATGSPPAGFSIYQGTGTGLCNGLAATATWTFTDVAEPGIGNDHASVNISGGCTLSVSGPLMQGNHQAHGQ